MTWLPCPNEPRCPHAGIIHDIYDAEDQVPRCCAEGCDCGKRPAGRDGPLTKAEYAGEMRRQPPRRTR